MVLPWPDVVGLGRIDVLHDMVEEPPLPDDVALHVDFDDGVHLRRRVRAVAGSAPAAMACSFGDRLVGDVERGRRVEFLVEDPHPIVMRRVALALLGVFPHRLAVPIDFLEALEAAGVVLGWRRGCCRCPADADWCRPARCERRVPPCREGSVRLPTPKSV